MTLSEVQSTAVSAAVLFESESFREPLLAALAVAGAAVTHELRFSDTALDDFSELKADVLIINLESQITRREDTLRHIIENFSGRIVFNDADATSAMVDADRPRWIRHLAAKISPQPDTDVMPPRPDTSSRRNLVPIKTPARAEEEFDIWFLVASIGGPEAVRAFLAEMPPRPNVAFVLIQHIGAEFVSQMIRQLDEVAPFPVELARDGQYLEAGRMFVVPPDKCTHIGTTRRFKLEPQRPGSRYSPCIDQVLGDAVERLGAGASAIIFSGMATDGVVSASRLIESNGEVWVQDPESCVVSAIVDGVIKHGGHRQTGSPTQLAKQLIQRMEDT